MDEHPPLIPDTGGPPARFLADLGAIVGSETLEKARFGIAVSGGPDSLALLLMAHKALSGRIAAATVDHCLRPESGDEARFVADICETRGIDHIIMTPASPIEGNVQSSARTERYRLLEQWRERQGLDFILTAHHADDQLETVVMRLNRSSGVAGLAGIRARHGRIVRPLLAWRRDDLGDVLAEAEVPFVDDPSNRDHRYDRARLRSALADADWLDAAAVARSAHLLGEAAEALDWATEQRLETALERSGHTLSLAYSDEPSALWHRMLLTALHRAQPGIRVGHDAFFRLWTAMMAGRKTSIGKLTVTPHPQNRQKWTIAPAPARRSDETGKSAKKMADRDSH